MVVLSRRARWLLPVGLALVLLPLSSPGAAEGSPGAAPAAAPAAAETTTITGSINAGDVQQTGRLTRDGRVHGCELPTAMPALENATGVRRDAHTLQNAHDTSRCIVVEADLTQCAGNQTQVVAYSAYNPANPAAGVIGNSGFSTIGTMRFGFRAPPQSSYTLVVNELTFNTGCPQYRLKVTNTPLNAVVTEGDAVNGFALVPTVNAFRDSLGVPAERREITWEEVPEALADPQSLPADYFNTVQPRGLVFTGPADVRVSSDGSGTTAPEFGDLGVNNEAQYQPFSFLRLMSPVSGEVADVAFRLPGTATPAPTRAFGAVFVNPGKAGYLLPRDAAGDPLGIYVPPEHPNGLAFYALQFPSPQIYSMSMAGNWGNGVSNTVFDNVIYADPGFRLTASATGPGRVTAPGLDCPGDCTERYGAAPVTLTAVPTGLAGVDWTGACAGTVGRTCIVSLSESDTVVAASFVSCEPLKAKLDKLKKALKKRKKAVKRATTRLAQAEGTAAVAEARAQLTKAQKALRKAKKKVRKAKRALQACLG